MPMERPETVSVSCFRFLTNSLRRRQLHWALSWERRETTVLVCFSSRRMSLREIRQRRCLRSSWRRRAWSSLDGEKFPFIRTSFPRRRETVCRILCRHLLKDRKMWRRDLILTVSCMWPAVYSSSPMMTLM